MRCDFYADVFLMLSKLSAVRNLSTCAVLRQQTSVAESGIGERGTASVLYEISQQWRIQGVSRVSRHPPFLKRTYFENMSLVGMVFG